MINNMVLSREIEWIGYEHKRNMLQVEFIVGSIYQYENVPETVYQEFLTAPSHGRLMSGPTNSGAVWDLRAGRVFPHRALRILWRSR